MPPHDHDDVLTLTRHLVQRQRDLGRLTRLRSREAVAAASAASDHAQLALMRAQKLTTSEEPPIPTHALTE
jgi:hypothetical protein